jgi:hypothetical protein
MLCHSLRCSLLRLAKIWVETFTKFHPNFHLTRGDCNECQFRVIFKFLKSCYSNAVSLTQLSSNSHLITANSARCKSSLYITRCPNFAMWRCFVVYFKECLTLQPFFYIIRHFDNYGTHSDAPSSYMPEFIEDNTTEKVKERLATLCNVSAYWYQVSRADLYYKL